MDTKEAIKKVEKFLITTRAYEALMTPTEKREHNFEINEVIMLLKRGEKFEEMYKKVGEHFKVYHIDYISKIALNKIIIKIFPKIK